VPAWTKRCVSFPAGCFRVEEQVRDADQRFDTKSLDARTKTEQNKYIKGIQKELIMTAFARDIAAFVSMSLFVASFAVLAMAF